MADSSDTFSSAQSYVLVEVRKAVYQGNFVFEWLLTGFGKSICYEDLPFVMEYKKGQHGSTLCSDLPRQQNKIQEFVSFL